MNKIEKTLHKLIKDIEVAQHYKHIMKSNNSVKNALMQAKEKLMKTLNDL